MEGDIIVRNVATHGDVQPFTSLFPLMSNFIRVVHEELIKEVRMSQILTKWLPSAKHLVYVEASGHSKSWYERCSLGSVARIYYKGVCSNFPSLSHHLQIEQQE